MNGKCVARRESNYWIASCFVKGQKMKIVRAKDFDVIKDYARKNELNLEVIDKLKTKKEGSVFSR